ncbi:putative Ig domain-containing protein [Dactylosporangium sp. NPDC000521]|uniref:putative Ig domain-containing protein n=1 Tax=Dactylosporangium sp. NPDC000521 TaxID=3363975 RepID=UPI0036A2F750
MRRTPPSDAGFSLVETLTSIAIIGVVMTALTTFFVRTTTTLNTQRGLQTAVRLAHDGVDLVKSLPGSTIVAGRGGLDAKQQLDDLKAGNIPGLELPSLKNLLDTMTPAFDAGLGPLAKSVAAPALPIGAEPLTVLNAEFSRYWFVGSCNMPLGNLSILKPEELGACSLASLPGILVPFYRVIVAVTWKNDRGCAGTGGVCHYVTQTLVSASATDPIFNPSVTVTPPLPDNPGDRTDEITVPMAAPLTLTATTAYPPLAWAVENLPPGLAWTPAGVISGTPTTAGSYVVRIVVTDAMSSNDASFTWTVAPLPALAPTTQAWDPNLPVSYQVPLTGGIGPFTWTATGLPSGLSINSTTGLITGTKPASAAATNTAIKVTAVDKNGKSATATFQLNWKVAVQFPNSTTPIALDKDAQYTGNVIGYGGTAPYTWSASDMPSGLSIDSAGKVTGKVSGTTRYLVKLNVTDSKGVTNSTLVPVNVSATTGLRVTSPSFDPKVWTPDLTSVKGTAVTNFPTLAATGGTGALTWAQDGLPPGMTLSGGKITGTPTTAGTYRVVLTVTDGSKAQSVFMFTWTVTG